jgi:glycosyltransferase involved in cell wall biosynthesis
VVQKKRRHRLLLMAAACNPYLSSDSLVGWIRAVQAARFFETWVICGEWDRAAIRCYLDTHGEIPGLHFCFLEKSWLEDLLKMGSPLYDIDYIPYNLWHRRAFHIAAKLHREIKFDLVHHVTRLCFREPGYLWKLGVPFIWGPLGGTQNYPWRFLWFAGINATLKEGLRSIINLFQLRFSPRIRKVMKKATFVIAASTTVQRDFERNHGIKPILLLDTGVSRVARLPKKSKGSPLRIIWSGRFEHRKALPLLLHALSEMPPNIEYELHILGEGRLGREWQELARSLGIDARCRWLGWLPYHQAVSQIDKADILVFTSLRDTSGNVVLEALSCGVPVICLDHQGVGDIITDNCGIKIPVTTPSEVVAHLRDELVNLASDNARLAGLAQGACERARQYLWSQNGEKMAMIYHAAITASGGVKIIDNAS